MVVGFRCIKHIRVSPKGKQGNRYEFLVNHVSHTYDSGSVTCVLWDLFSFIDFFGETTSYCGTLNSNNTYMRNKSVNPNDY